MRAEPSCDHRRPMNARKHLPPSLLLLLAAFASACATAPKQVDPCALVTPDEVQSIEGETTRETTRSRAEAGALTGEQCFYALPTFAKSFTVTVMSGGNIEQEWEKLFEEREEREKEGEEEEESAAVEHIGGLGQDARWSVGRYGGVLHVRTRGAIVRVTTGSTGDEADRLRRARAVAKIVLAKL